MKKIERIALWTISLMLIAAGVVSVAFQAFGQGGKLGARIPPITGSLAVVFGAVFIAIGGYFAYLLWRSSAELRNRRHSEKVEPTPGSDT